MKKVIFITTVLFAITTAFGQQSVSKNALGVRFGSNDGFGAEISYQHKLSSENRLEFDLGFRNSNDYSAFKLAGLYQWVWNIDKGFNWYAGVGAGVGSWSYDKNKNKESGAFVFGAGDIGIEYNFDIPLQISLDFRPELYLNSGAYRNSNFGSDIGLGLRYKF